MLIRFITCEYDYKHDEFNYNISLHTQQDEAFRHRKVCNDASQKFSTALEQYRHAIKSRQASNCQ